MSLPVLDCLPQVAMGLTLHRLGLWELTLTAAEVKPWCINGAPVYPGWAHKMLQVELDLTRSYRALSVPAADPWNGPPGGPLLP